MQTSTDNKSAVQASARIFFSPKMKKGNTPQPIKGRINRQNFDFNFQFEEKSSFEEQKQNLSNPKPDKLIQMRKSYDQIPKRIQSNSPGKKNPIQIVNRGGPTTKQRQMAFKMSNFVGLGTKVAQVFEFLSNNCSCDLKDTKLRRSFAKGFTKDKRITCNRALQWLNICYGENHAEQSEQFQKMYIDILDAQIDITEHVHQIKRDLSRTFPEEDYYKEGFTGQKRLFRCLQAFCKYDINLGYVQGMNFIMGALLWHATEADAFWLFVSLVEKYELRDIYLPGLPGLCKHCQIIDLLISQNLPKLYKHFAENRMVAEMYATD